MIRTVITTFADEETAVAVSRRLVEKRLAACATLIPGARSIYRWKNEIHDEKEIIVLFKLSSTTYDLFITEISKHHPYQTPELITIDPNQTSESYSEWVLLQCEGANHE
ncbi:MAG: divalent cation tolerance protein CutA [Terrimicrobiaceae bacterium]